MSAYVLSWLNDELQLSNGPVNAIEREFASGYLFAEVIHKAHPKQFTVDDLAEFQNEKKGTVSPIRLEVLLETGFSGSSSTSVLA